MPTSRLLIIVSVYLLAWCFVTEASATFIKIQSTAELSAEFEQQQGRIHGVYRIQNLGNEAAQRVTPVFRFGSYRFVGESKSIRPLQTAVWDVRLAISSSGLPCAGLHGCSAASERVSGVFPLIVENSYEDSNGQVFQAMHLERIFLGKMADTSAEQDAVELLFRCGSGVDKYHCDLTIRNNGSEAREVVLQVLAPAEFEASGEMISRTIGSGDVQTVVVTLKNRRANAASSYSVFAVCQWQFAGKHFAQVASANVKTLEAPRGSLYLWLAALALLAEIVCFGVLLSKTGLFSKTD